MEDKNGFVNRLIIILYFIVAFIPNLGAHEIVNTQWLYIGILNVLSLGYIFVKRKDYNLLDTSKLALSVFAGGLLFLLVSLLSITKSIVVSESIVALSYLVLTLISLFVFYLIVKQNPKKYFYFFTLLIACIGVVEALQVVNYFNLHNKEIRTAELLTAINHNYGNRNILAISIVMKFPFIFYFYSKQKGLYKVLSGMALFFVFVSVLLIGTRTAIFGGLIILFALLIYMFLVMECSMKIFLKDLLGLLIVAGLSLFVSLNLNKIHGSKLNSFNDLVFTKSKEDIYVKSDKQAGLGNSSGRDKFWIAAIEDIKKNPFLGVGIGNWKLMPKEELIKKTEKKNYFYPRRVHNDFLQTFSEIGVFGFLLYIVLYIVIIGALLKRIIRDLKNSKKEKAFITVILLGSLSIYFLDSFFNFPHERTPIQVFTFFILALILSFTTSKITLKIKKIPVLIVLMSLSVLFLFLSYKSYSASKIHKDLYGDFIGKDFFKEKYNTSYEEVINKLPDYPELDAYGRSTSIMKAFFAFNSKEKTKAIEHINEASKIGPYHAEPFGLKALLYYQDKDLKNLDSAFYYAKKAFKIQPSKKQNFEILRRIYARKNDTINLIKTLNTYTSVITTDVEAWIKKAEHLYVYKKGYDRFLEVLDSAVALNPKNEKIIAYRKKKGRFKKEAKEARLANNVIMEKYYNRANKLMNEKKYKESRKEFYKVLELDENNMATFVNLGILERVTKNYKQSIMFLTKVIDANFMKNGQPEYNRGLSYHKLGDDVKAMLDLEISRIKGYSAAQKYIDIIKK